MSNSLAVQTTDQISSTNSTCQNINHLPDPVLRHLLSFLPTREAVATSVLSERWRSLWTRVPVLDFQDSPRCQIDEKRRIKFSDLVYSALILNRVVSLDKFRLKCPIDHGSSRLNTWIYGAIRVGDAREIDISISATEKSQFFKLPSFFFTVTNLQVLKLSHGILIDVPIGMSVCFPSLKVLRLMWVEYANNDSVLRLFGGCTVLEELVVDRFSEDNVRNFIISVPTLKSLSYIAHQEKQKWLHLVRCRYQLTINAPNLEYLKIKNVGSFVHFESVFISLIKANIDFNGIGLFQLAKALCNAKFLSLEWITCGDIRASLNSDSFPLFLNLTQLELKIDAEDLDVIPLFLENSCKLEVLVLNKIVGSSHKLSRTSKQGSVPKCVSQHLRKVYVGGFQGHEDELEMVKYILNNAGALELIEICCYDIPLESKFRMLQKLSKFPRNSDTCQLKFNPQTCLLNPRDFSVVRRRHEKLRKLLQQFLFMD